MPNIIVRTTAFIDQDFSNSYDYPSRSRLIQLRGFGGRLVDPRPGQRAKALKRSVTPWSTRFAIIAVRLVD